MSRQLRLGFAMGGGVSLGTFSGAALSEAIKLVVLRAEWQDADGDAHPYDEVVIDVFSGASAGAMALALMLRCLVSRAPDQEAHAEQRLLDEFGDEFSDLSPERRRDVIAAQVVQDVQERVWVHDVSLDRLLGRDRGPGSRPRDLRHEAGILDRSAVDAIAARELLPPEDGMPLGNRRLLGSRVLFACALSNLTPVLYDGRGQGDAHRAGYLGLGDGLTSWGHRELRVFDLSFDERDVQTPSRWCRYHAADEREGRIGDVRRRRTWARIAATAIAAGAFPFAFAPVVLKRKRYEYQHLWPDRLDGLDEYPFTYVDGGTFNNEPIREAFRLASFIDAQNPDGDFDRRIVFVDPRVGSLDVSMRVPVHTEFFLQAANAFGSLDGIDLRRYATLDRLKSTAGSIAAAILNESTTIEEDKVYGTMSRFDLRDEMRGALDGVLRGDADAAAFRAVEELCTRRLETRRDRLTPEGSLSLAAELRRVVAEVPDFEHLRGGVDEFLDRDDPTASPHADDWLKALVYLALDLSMGLGGKREENGLIAIAPFVNVKEKKDDADPVPLPGGVVKGFGGFTSPVPGEYEVALGRHCAREFLEACAVIAADDDPSAPPAWTPENEQAFRTDLERGLRSLADRVKAMIERTHLLQLFPGVDGFVLGKIADRVHSAVVALADPEPATIRYEFRIHVPDKRFEFDGAGIGDRDIGPVRPSDESLCLITFADYRPGDDDEPGTWSGPHVSEGRTGPEIRVHRDRRGPLPDRAYCTIALPDAALLEAADRLPNPIFEGELVEADHEEEQEIPDFWRLAGPGVASLEDTLADG